MTPAKAKLMAKRRGWDFWWDRSAQVWTLTRMDPSDSTEAVHIAARPLRLLDVDTFRSRYLTLADESETATEQAAGGHQPGDSDSAAGVF